MFVAEKACPGNRVVRAVTLVGEMPLAAIISKPQKFELGTILPELLRPVADYQELFFATLVIVVVMFFPGGLVELLRRASALSVRRRTKRGATTMHVSHRCSNAHSCCNRLSRCRRNSPCSERPACKLSISLTKARPRLPIGNRSNLL